MTNYTAIPLCLNSLHNHTNLLLWSSSSTVLSASHLTANKPGSLAGNIILTACLTLIFHNHWHLLSKPQKSSHKDFTSYCSPQERGVQRCSLFPLNGCCLIHTATGRAVSLWLIPFSLFWRLSHNPLVFIYHQPLQASFLRMTSPESEKNPKSIYQTKNVTTNPWLSGSLLYKLILASNPLFLVRSTATVKISCPFLTHPHVALFQTFSWQQYPAEAITSTLHLVPAETFTLTLHPKLLEICTKIIIGQSTWSSTNTHMQCLC